MEFPADATWMTLTEYRQHRWTVERWIFSGNPGPFAQPSFRFRRSAQRWAANNNSADVIYLVKRTSKDATDDAYHAESCRCIHHSWDSFNPAPPVPVLATVEEQPIQNFDG